MTDRSILPIPYLLQCLDADFKSGLIVWQRRPPSHFANVRACNIFNAKFPGKPALSQDNGNGYKRGSLAFEGRLVRVYAHRALFAMHYGVWADEIDHIDGDRSNNSIENLRNTSRAENAINTKIRKHSRSQIKGVGWLDRPTPWRARITKGGVSKTIGYFKTKEEASDAYNRAAARFHGEFVRNAAHGGI